MRITIETGDMTESRHLTQTSYGSMAGDQMALFAGEQTATDAGPPAEALVAALGGGKANGMTNGHASTDSEDAGQSPSWLMDVIDGGAPDVD
jgi:hypothetical protein